MQILRIYLMGLAWLMENCIKWARATWKRPSSLCAGVEIRQPSHAPKIAKCSRINHFWRCHNAIWSSCKKNRVGLATMHIKGSPPWFVWSFTFNHHHHHLLLLMIFILEIGTPLVPYVEYFKLICLFLQNFIVSQLIYSN